MSVVSLPRVTIQITAANIVDAFDDRVDLLVGMQTPSATATEKTLYTNVQALDKDARDTLFGARSDLVNKILQHQAGSDGYNRLDVIPLDDAGAGTAATGVVEFAGTATEDGSISISVVDSKQYTVTIDVVTGDEGGDVGDALEAALTALSRLPVTAANVTVTTTGTVTLTAANKGTIGNLFGNVNIAGTVGGITTTITGFASGATDPTVTGLFDVVGEERYFGVGWCEYLLDEKTEVISFMSDRFNVSNDILDGTAFVGMSNTFSANKAFVDAENSQFLVYMGNNVQATTTKDGAALLKPADWNAAYFMGVRSKRLTPDAPISGDIVATNGRFDNIGGPALASLPLFNTVDAEALIAPSDEIYTTLEQTEIEDSGFSVVGTNRSKNGVVFGPVVTPYTTDGAGNENPSFHYLNYIDTISVCREIFFNSIKERFSQSRLTEGDTVAGRNIENAQTIKAHLLYVYRILSELVLVQKGSEAETYFSANTTVEVNLAQRKATITGPIPIVTQLEQIDYVMQLSFTLNEGQQIVF